MTGSVVSNISGNVLATQDTSTNVVTTLVEGIVVANSQGSIVTLPLTSSILVERDRASILVTGIMGPPGPSGTNEDDVMYSKRIDFTTDSTLYRGEAVVGSSENSNTWRIRYIVIGNDGDVSETWASGNANFDKVWADRALLSYT